MLSDVRMERSRRSRPMACEDACMYNKVSMIRKYLNHILQTNPRHSEKEPQNTYRNNTSVRQ